MYILAILKRATNSRLNSTDISIYSYPLAFHGLVIKVNGRLTVQHSDLDLSPRLRLRFHDHNLFQVDECALMTNMLVFYTFTAVPVTLQHQ